MEDRPASRANGSTSGYENTFASPPELRTAVPSRHEQKTSHGGCEINDSPAVDNIAEAVPDIEATAERGDSQGATLLQSQEFSKDASERRLHEEKKEKDDEMDKAEVLRLFGHAVVETEAEREATVESEGPDHGRQESASSTAAIGVVGRRGSRNRSLLSHSSRDSSLGSGLESKGRHSVCAWWDNDGLEEGGGAIEQGTLTRESHSDLNSEVDDLGKEKTTKTLVGNLIHAYDLTEVVRTVYMARKCSLLPSDEDLQRGEELGAGRFGTVTRVSHELGMFALKELNAVRAMPIRWCVSSAAYHYVKYSRA